MPLDPLIQTLFKQMPDLANYPIWEMSPKDARENFRTLCQLANTGTVPIGKTEDLEAPGPGGPIPVRVYTPVAAGGASLPAIVFFHGGGFVLGDLDCYDGMCRTLANESSCRVVSADYRLAPEHKFPAAVEDAFAVTAWVEAHAPELGIDPNRIAAAGDSAGGNLAAVVTQLAKTKGAPHIAFQMLLYPTTSLDHGPSAATFASGYMLNLPAINWFTMQYVEKGTDRRDPRLSPLTADLAGLPPAYIVTAGFDPLRDEAIAYGDKLKAAGVPVRLVDYPSMIHGFFSMGGMVPLAGEALAAAGHAAKDALS